MTGIEMLREWANELREAARAYRDGEIGYVPIDVDACQRKNAARLDAIADQIEREIKEALTDGADDEDDAFVDMRGARTGIEMLRSYVHHARVYVRNLYINHVADINAVPLYEKLRECLRQLDEIADRIECETLPRPRFEDGEVVQIGDKAMFHGTEQEVDSYSVTQDGDALINSIVNCFWLSHKGRAKRPEPPKVLDADGVEIKVGDEVWEVEDGIDPLTVVEINGERVIGKLSSVLLVDIHCSKVTHKRPEPPDTWEKLDADIEDCDGTACDYFGKIDEEGRPICRECNAYNDDTDCTVLVMRDLVRRAKKLAGVE